MNRSFHNPSISVVIPNRNDGNYLEACLSSVLNQSIQPDQIVFVDDCSSDNSVAIAEMHLQDFDNAKITINAKQLGTVGAINKGLQWATGDYVLLLASNDYVRDGLFERAKQSIAATGSPGVWSAMVWTVDQSGVPLYLYPSSVVRLKGGFIPPRACIKLAMRTAGWFMGTTLFFNRKALSEIGGLDEEYQGLADFIAALTISSLNGATYVAEPLGVMRIHQDGYLLRTLSDLNNLERIISRIENRGRVHSPRLFTPAFCRRLRSRFRFAAIRTHNDIRSVEWPAAWDGVQYRLLKNALRMIENQRVLKTCAAMLLLRPFDILPMLWYRLAGPLLVLARAR